MFAEGEADDNLCQACGQEVGTIRHRLLGCRIDEDLRAAHRDQDILATANTDENRHEPLFNHGIPRRSKKLKRPPAVTRVAGGNHRGGDTTFTGEVFTDGALRSGGPHGTDRGGWAAVQIDSQGKIVKGIYGTVAEYTMSSLVTELMGIYHALKHSLGDITIYTDNAAAVAGWAAGKDYCTSSQHPAATQWRKIWTVAEDIGIEHIQIRKCMAHTAPPQMWTEA